MSENKTKPSEASVSTFLATVSDQRQEESQIIIGMMQKITKQVPVMWGPSIIGFGSQHYKYDSGREGDMPQLGFSPRKTSITIYFSEGFSPHASQLKKLGKHKNSVTCLYINKLSDVDTAVLHQMLAKSYQNLGNFLDKPKTVDEYVDRIPAASKDQFAKLRELVKNEVPQANEVLSYGIIGYKINDKRARIFVSGWKDHVAMYPVPKSENLQAKLMPYIKGKGTLWFSLDKPLPTHLIRQSVKALL